MGIRINNRSEKPVFHLFSKQSNRLILPVNSPGTNTQNAFNSPRIVQAALIPVADIFPMAGFREPRQRFAGMKNALLTITLFTAALRGVKATLPNWALCAGYGYTGPPDCSPGWVCTPLNQFMSHASNIKLRISTDEHRIRCLSFTIFEAIKEETEETEELDDLETEEFETLDLADGANMIPLLLDADPLEDDVPVPLDFSSVESGDNMSDLDEEELQSEVTLSKFAEKLRAGMLSQETLKSTKHRQTARIRVETEVLRSQGYGNIHGFLSKQSKLLREESIILLVLNPQIELIQTAVVAWEEEEEEEEENVEIIFLGLRTQPLVLEELGTADDVEITNRDNRHDPNIVIEPHDTRKVQNTWGLGAGQPPGMPISSTPPITKFHLWKTTLLQLHQ
ncbi:hypothetical protein M422DRAFT_780329 [Sphaerobolus stellatus SS14]|uniref:CBM1 domain-containing protein n=1 Tax=Sphaerobolus stellatus (strain SS14) TaxID=990650 RepID=A0A0C9VIT3_SPHS4|nr:hypothetical protein M422DRAFT_780329 [Sphaerobolus stellatus SS14]